MPDRSKENWLALCPDLTIDDACTDILTVRWSDEELAAISTRFQEDGFLNLPSVIPGAMCQLIANAQSRLADAKIPAVYIYVYDQPWLLFESLRPLISHFLGEGYALLPNFWAWNLDTPGQSGWPPHRDCDAETVFEIGGDKILMSLSLWVPLTDVDEQNGCMYVVPRSAEDQLKTLSVKDRDNLRPLAKALPAAAGSVLGWPQDLYHFGSDYHEGATTPRRSLSFEFQNAGFDPLATPLLSTQTLPDFNARLTLMAEQITKYRHMDPGA